MQGDEAGGRCIQQQTGAIILSAEYPNKYPVQKREGTGLMAGAFRVPFLAATNGANADDGIPLEILAFFIFA